MTTPVYNFVKKYAERDGARFHMPGHKGKSTLGCEAYDITEISGSDVLYSADSIINESENNLTKLYGTYHSFYSTEGSTLAIKAMLRIVSARAGQERPLVIAARNVHASFVRAAGLLDLDVDFIYPDCAQHLCSCNITADNVREALAKAKKKPCAVYITSPDYLGNMLDVAAIAAVCRENDIPLLVDNAHGAYLKFVEQDMHPIALGAAMCADSAHKTLPVLTGGAYLHISRDYSEYVADAREALSLFASTSPSYLTLCSLDLCNKRLSADYPEKIRALANRIDEVKAKIIQLGFELVNSEPFKIVLKGGSIADHLRIRDIEPEFADRDYTVLMLTPENSEQELERLVSALAEIEPCSSNREHLPIKPHKRAMSIRSAVLSMSEEIEVCYAEGRVCASPTVSCPPAVPIVISGEIITADDVEILKYYGIETLRVVK